MEVRHRKPHRIATVRIPDRRQGFSIIELTVAMAVIAVLAAIILPAVQSSREAARRLQCSSQLKQLTLGVHNYESSYSCLPMFRSRWEIPGGNISVFKSLFPHLGIGADISLPRRVELLACPSDAMTARVAAPLSYVINGGPNLQRMGEWDGIVASQTGEDLCVRFGNVTDGASHTACFSERLGSFGGSPPGTVPTPAKRYRWNITVLSPPSNFANFYEEATRACEDGPRTLISGVGGGGTLDWWFGDGSINCLYSHLMRPNTPQCQATPAAGFLPLWGGYATSDHRGGVNVSYLDGNVRFVSETVDHRVWRAIGSRDGGETVE